MTRIDTLIVGGGQSGLAMSRMLSEATVEHVVLERGEVAERWKRASWDSLRLLTPRWQARLPGWSYSGDDPDGYMHWSETVTYLEDFAASFSAPVIGGEEVVSLRATDDRFFVRTARRTWLADQVVIATGDCQRARVPAFARRIHPGVHQIDPTRYRNPSSLPPGAVLVVGASSTGVQLAAEIHASGRPVTLAVGRHTRLPRSYRGRDILWWLDRMGVLDERADQVSDLRASSEQPSLQLVGTGERRTIDLASLLAAGVRLVGRARDATGYRVLFEDDLVEHTVAADVKLARLLERIEAYASATGLGAVLPQAPRFEPTPWLSSPPSLDLRAEGIGTVLWATGYERNYDWLEVPVLDPRGEILHVGGVTPVPGLYVLGLRFLRRRKSSFLDGAADDARDLCVHLLTHRMTRRARGVAA